MTEHDDLPPRATTGARRSLSKRAVEKRWDTAIDIVLNSGLLADRLEVFWAYVDGIATRSELEEMFP